MQTTLNDYKRGKSSCKKGKKSWYRAELEDAFFAESSLICAKSIRMPRF